MAHRNRTRNRNKYVSNLNKTRVLGYVLLIGGVGAGAYYLYKASEDGDLPDFIQDAKKDVENLLQSPTPESRGKICYPGDQTCSGSDLWQCSDDGTKWELIEENSPTCGASGWEDPSDEAEEKATQEYTEFLDLSTTEKEQWAVDWTNEHFLRLLQGYPVYDRSLGVPDSSEPGVVEAAREREDYKVDAVMDLVYNMPEDAPEEEKLAARKLYFMYGETGGGLI